ncbi:GpE family phage tail protein [Burkholderia contaminans]|uniref:GpE family phage tail protein n=1 Tax=Burkholderia contaminans TaxID=488447 RepID=A0A3N8QUX6_9BURK|nr:GpE family phage tail protein [Burkholderia contaminans]RQT09833.1 GpE family phage tail protein [Burkholderia contaminans]
MADVALVFHWPPSVMDGMSVSELMDWRERARERYEKQ